MSKRCIKISRTKDGKIPKTTMWVVGNHNLPYLRQDTNVAIEYTNPFHVRNSIIYAYGLIVVVCPKKGGGKGP